MDNIQIIGLQENLEKIVLEDFQDLQKKLNYQLSASDRTLIDNLIKETKFLLEQVVDDSKKITYHKKSVIFQKITKNWIDTWSHYNDNPQAIELGYSMAHFTNYSTAYSHLFWSLYLINENRTGENKHDMKRIVSGFLVLSEVIDVFIDFFDISELNQIYDAVENVFNNSSRDINEYFEDELECFENGLNLSNLVTQLRAYSSLILMKIEKYLKQQRNIFLEKKLKEMAKDPEIQAEMKAINEEFLVTEMDGLD